LLVQFYLFRCFHEIFLGDWHYLMFSSIVFKRGMFYGAGKSHVPDKT
jgi:hypothetical protein